MTDFHVHTRISSDSTEPMSAYLPVARELVKSVGLTEVIFRNRMRVQI